MSDESNQEKKSLAEEIKRRRALEVRRNIEAENLKRALGNTPALPQSAKPQVAASPRVPSTSSNGNSAPNATRRTSPEVEVVKGDKRTAFRALTARQKTMLISASAGVMILIVCVGSFLIMSSSASDVSPTLVAVGIVNVDSVLQHFKDVGVPMANVQPYDVVNSKAWNATTGYQFNIQNGSKRGSFVLLGYASEQDATGDLSKIQVGATYKNWSKSFGGNILLLASPDTTDSLWSDITSHMKSYLFAPYRPGWPTATPVATSAPKPTAKGMAATAKAN